MRLQESIQQGEYMRPVFAVEFLNIYNFTDNIGKAQIVIHNIYPKIRNWFLAIPVFLLQAKS